MDNDLQGNFNLKAYGLAVRLLHADVPLKWIIKPDKDKDGDDFKADASRVLPTAIASRKDIRFCAGPLAVHPGFESQALAVMNAYGNNVAVYQLDDNAEVNVDSTLSHKPRVAVFDQGGKGSLHVAVLQEAGLTMFTHYQTLNNATNIGAGSCFTVATEPHSDNAGGATALMNFLLSGGNFFGQCAAVRSYTQQGLLSGYQDDGILGGTMKFDHFGDPMAQFEGGLDDVVGSLVSFKLTSNPGFRIAYSSKDGARYKAYVGRVAGGPVIGGWVHYLAGHEYKGSDVTSINGRRMLLNAVLRPASRPDSCGLSIPLDYGDYSGFAITTQTAHAAIRIGTTATDAEVTNPANATATGDDNSGTDDENLTMPAFTVGAATTLSIPVTITSASLVSRTSRLNVFVDWNGDGDVADFGETQTTQSAISSGTRTFSLTPPPGTTAGTKFLRIRFTEGTTAPTFTGASILKGEVEDYAIIVNSTDPTTDLGDWNGSGASTLTTSSATNNNLRLGATVDAEAAVTPDANATADGADEDGVNPLPVMTPGGWGWLNTNVTNNTSALGYLNAWIDFNNDGDFADVGEQIVSNVSIATGTANTARLVPFRVPAAAITGTNLGMRVRLTSTSSPGATGASGTGEVEDYIVQVTAPSTPASGEWLVTDHGPYFTATRGSPRIWRLPSAGGTSATTTAPAGMVTWSTATPEPMGIAHLNGNFYVTDFAQADTTTTRPTVVEVAPNGVPTGKSWTLGSSTATVPNAWDIIASGSNLYVALFNSPNGAAGIYRIDPTAFATGQNFITTPWSALRPVGNWRGPNGLAIGSGSQAGNLLASVENGASQNGVYVIPLSTGTVPGAALFNETSVTGQPGSSGIRDIDTDPAGNIYVSQARLGTLRRYTSAGVLSDANWMSIGVVNSYNPTGSAWGADGNQYLIAYDGGDVWRHGNVSGGQTQWLNWLGGDSATEMFKPKYLVQVPAPLTDFGDWNGSGAATTTTSSAVNINLRLGATLDAEAGVTPNATATADGADEDALTMPASLTPGTSVTIPVSVFNNTGSNAFLSAWIDFNNDGSFNNTLVSSGGERLQSAATIASAVSPTTTNITFTVPAGASVGSQRGVRFRLSSDVLSGPTGSGGTGEIEDYVVQICSPMIICPVVSTLPTATQGTAYSLPLSVLGGTGPYTFSITTGALPAGLNLNTTTGLISGTPTTLQSATFTVTGRDSLNCLISRSYSVQVLAPGTTVQVFGGAGTGNVPITAASYIVNGVTNNQSAEVSGTNVAVQTNSEINLLSLTINDNGLIKTLGVANLNGGSLANVNLSGFEGSFGVHLNGSVTTVAASGTPAFMTSAAQISTNNNLNHYIFDDRGDGEPDATGEYDIRFNYAFTGEDYIVCQERFGNSHIQLQPLDASGNVIPGSRTVQVRGTHDWNTGYSSSYIGSQPYFLTVIRQTIFGTAAPIFGFRLSISGADCKFFGMSDSPFTDNPTSAGLIGDRVWNDENQNGIQDAGETGVSGVTVRLLNAVSLQVVSSTTTDSSGIYGFSGVMPGDYRIEFVAPSGAAFSPKDSGSNDVVDSDANPADGRTDVFTMMPCDSLSHFDAGIQSIPDFGDYAGFASAAQAASSAIRIGTAATDTEASTSVNGTATADDTNGTDDEDLTMPTFTVGSATTLSLPMTITAASLSGSTARVNVFVDWNGDGFVTGTNETLTAQAVSASGTFNFSLTPPVGTTPGTKYLRIRAAEGVTHPGFSGSSNLRGEVEDYAVNVISPLLAFDFNVGDAVNNANPSIRDSCLTDGILQFRDGFNGLTVSDNPKGVNGPTLTGPTSGNTLRCSNRWPLTLDPAFTSTRTSLTGLNKSMWTLFTVGSVTSGSITNASIDIARQTSGTARRAQAFLTWHDGATYRTAYSTVVTMENRFWDPGPLTTGHSAWQTVVFPGFTNGTPLPTGSGLSGETFLLEVAFFDQQGGWSSGNQLESDNLILNGSLICSPSDFGDYSGFTSASQSVSSAIRIGATAPDVDTVNPATATALGDDNSGTDDEDLTMPGFIIGTATSLSIPVTITQASLVGSTSRINVFVDWNGDGDVTDAAETQTAQSVISSGTRTFSLTPPLGTIAGIKYLRIRFTEGSSAPAFSGASPLRGEVEDYAVVVRAVPGLELGNLVWHDANCNGLKDAAEVGIGGIVMSAYSRGPNNIAYDADDVLIASTTTAANGSYRISDLEPGSFYVRLSPPTDFPMVTTTAVNLDNGTDNDNNGLQPGGVGTLIRSPVITLSASGEPTAEDGDSNTDFTIDFGLVPSTLGIGNVVFNDFNSNGRFDVNEGINGVTIQLYNSTQTPGVDTPLATTTTSNGGRYLFENLTRGSYIVHLPRSVFAVGTGLLGGTLSVPGAQTDDSDDQLGEDTIDALNPALTGLSTRVISLDFKQQPTDADTELGFDRTSDNSPASRELDYDLTVDLGVFRPVALGNLVFHDANGNGRAEVGEGLDGVPLHLYTFAQVIGVDTPILTTTSANGGLYLFKDLIPGNYVVHIPGSAFATGGPLNGKVSISEGLSGDDNVGEDGINVINPEVVGIRSLPVSITAGQAPTDLNGETGLDAASDNSLDAAIDLTVDFGFQNPVGIGNLVFIDGNANGRFDSDEGLDGVQVELYRAGQTPGETLPIFTQTTSGGGRYLFNFLTTGSYIVYVPSSQFIAGSPLAGTLSVPGTVNGDDDLGEDGIDDPNPSLNGVRSGVIVLADDGSPIDANTETGAFNTSDNGDDNNFNLTVDLGFRASNPNVVSIGNLVFRDLNGNGIFNTGEGVDGVLVRLFEGTANPLEASPLASVTTSQGGRYQFTNLTPGTYMVHIPGSEFTGSKPLAGFISVPGNGTDNQVDDHLIGGENGIDSATITTSGIRSAVIDLQINSEPTDSLTEQGFNTFMDNADDNNGDMTVDFAFYSPVSIGNLVFIDANQNGRADAGEGAPGVTVEIYQQGSSPGFDAPVSSVVTNASGRYLFAGIEPGTYYVHIPNSQFVFGAPLESMASVTGTVSGDDDTGEDGIDETQPHIFGIYSSVFTTRAGSEPTGTSESGQGGAEDDARDAFGNMTIDFGFVPQVRVGNLVFLDRNNDRVFDSGNEIGAEGVRVELWSTADSNKPVGTVDTDEFGLYQFRTSPGTYYIRIPASQFRSGGALVNTVSSQDPLTASAASDDDLGEDGLDTANPASTGVQTAPFVLAADLAPTAAGIEIGYHSESDDAADGNADLTLDLGFAPKPLFVGNLVFRDQNADGRFTAGTDLGYANVPVRLFEQGQNPATATPVASTLTSADGTFRMQTRTSGDYFLHIPAIAFTAGQPLAGASSIPGLGTDNGADDNLGENGVDNANPSVNGISSSPFSLYYGFEPLDSGTEKGFAAHIDSAQGVDADGDMTIDFGFTGGTPIVQTLRVGNLVFQDANENGFFDSGEGVGGVVVKLFPAGADPLTALPLNTVTTESPTPTRGRYEFANVAPGSYFVFIDPVNFLSTGPLHRRVSILGNQGGAFQTALGDDNTGEDGLDSQKPEVTGIRSSTFTLASDTGPTGSQESGFRGTDDDAADSSGNLTIDFGFRNRIGFGNLVFRDLNADGRWTSGTDQTLSGVEVQLVSMNGNTERGVAATTTTSASGTYLLYAPSGSYRLRIPGTQFAPGRLLSIYVPSSIHLSGTDDDANQDGLATATPATTGVSTATGTFTLGTQPSTTAGNEPGYDKDSDTAEDANVNLTLDFGFVPRSIGVGNLVFRDTNANSTYQAGIDEPLAGVTVRLFASGADPATATPISSSVSLADGTYFLEAPLPGSYFVHVPASNFQSGGVLLGLAAATTAGSSITNFDDTTDQNALSAANPGTTGISTGVFALAKNTMPINGTGTGQAENGFNKSYDDWADHWANLTIDLGFATSGAPQSGRLTNTLSTPAATFTAWQSANGLNGENTATDNADGDAYSNLAEYALGLKPDSGVLARAPFSLKVNAQTGGIDAVLHRPATSRDDIAFTLEGATGGPASTLWSALSLVPTSTVLSDGTQVLTYTSVQGAAAFAGASTGFVRVKISLDADQNGTPEATTYTPVFAWSLIMFEVGQQTFSMPLLTDEVFSGSVLAATGTTLTLATGTDNLRARFTAGTAYYAEITSGSLAGHRFEINETASTANTVVLETETALTAGVTLSIRPHWTLSSVFTPALFNGSDSAETADRLLLFEEGAFVPVWLNGSTWTRDGEGVNSHILSPGQGLLIQPRTQALTLPVAGQVRTTAFVMPLKAGNQLTGTGYPFAQSPVQRGLNTPAFTASAEPTTADRLRLWIGDTTPGASGYVSYYLKQTASGPQWTPESGEAPTSQNEAPLFQPFRATFLKTTQDHPAHVESPR
jgi:hypothetical protein